MGALRELSAIAVTGKREINAKEFIHDYWKYFLELEEQLLETKRYVEFAQENRKAYSLEYLKLYQSVCSEIDVLGKELAGSASQDFHVDRKTTIKQWGYALMQVYPELKDELVIFDECMEQQPFKDWEYEKNIITEKNGKQRVILRKKNEKALRWWKEYNEVKHRRVGLIGGTKNYKLANQENLILAFSGLYILERKFILKLVLPEVQDDLLRQSRLFR